MVCTKLLWWEWLRRQSGRGGWESLGLAGRPDALGCMAAGQRLAGPAGWCGDARLRASAPVAVGISPHQLSSCSQLGLHPQLVVGSRKALRRPDVLEALGPAPDGDRRWVPDRGRRLRQHAGRGGHDAVRQLAQCGGRRCRGGRHRERVAAKGASRGLAKRAEGGVFLGSGRRGGVGIGNRASGGQNLRKKINSRHGARTHDKSVKSRTLYQLS